MKFFGSISSFLTILNESMRLLPKNGKLMALIAIISVFLSLCFSFLFSYSLQSVVAHMLVSMQQSFLPDPTTFNMPDTPDPNSPTYDTGFNPFQFIGPPALRGDFAILFAVEFTFLLAISIISFFSSISTILVSAVSHTSKNLSLNELFSTILKTCTKPLITTFYVSCLSTGYFVSVITLLVPLLMCPNRAALWVACLVGITACIFYLYLVVPWIISIVVSVVEESCYGLEALGKGAALVKGKRLHGFLLNVFFNLVFLILFQGYKTILGKNLSPSVSLMLLTAAIPLVKIVQMVAYTVFYFQCKELHGEEIELPGSVHYTKLPITQLPNDMR
ncbi:hypothetical protein ACS0TY_031876 [Phlomoides rotata]